MSDIEVRPALPDELDAVGELTAAAYLADRPVGDDYLALLRDARTRSEVAELLVAVDSDGGLLGTVTLVGPDGDEQWRETSPHDAATMRMLAVAPSARRRGIGRLLTQACVDRCAQRGWRSLCLLTLTSMTAAQSLYASYGFVRDESLDVEISPEIVLIGYRIATG